MALAVPLSRLTSRVGGGSAFFVRCLMTTILNAKWHGIAALIWLSFGLIMTVLMARFLVDHSVVGFIIWLFLGWLSPVLLLAISGLRRGTPANRVCAVLALVAFVALVWVTMLVPVFFSPTRS